MTLKKKRKQNQVILRESKEFKNLLPRQKQHERITRTIKVSCLSRFLRRGSYCQDNSETPWQLRNLQATFVPQHSYRLDNSCHDCKNARPRFAWLIGARHTLPSAIYVPASGSECSELAGVDGKAPSRQAGSSLSRPCRDLTLGPLYCRAVSFNW